MGEAWAGIPQDQVQQALEEAGAPQGLVEWTVWLVQQLVTVNVVWVLVSLLLGLVAAIGVTEASKRFEKLFSGPRWMLRAQLYASLWGSVVTALLIAVTTDFPPAGETVAILAIAPLAGLYAPRTYDVLRRLFPHLMARASKRLRGEQNCDVSPP